MCQQTPLSPSLARKFRALCSVDHLPNSSPVRTVGQSGTSNLPRWARPRTARTSRYEAFCQRNVCFCETSFLAVSKRTAMNQRESVLVTVIHITSAIEPSFYASHVVVGCVLGRVADFFWEDHYSKTNLVSVSPCRLCERVNHYTRPAAHRLFQRLSTKLAAGNAQRLTPRHRGQRTFNCLPRLCPTRCLRAAAASL